MKFRIIRSKRTTLALEIKDEEIIVRAPQGASVREIDAFVNSHKDWIEKRIAKMKEAKRQALEKPLSEDEIDELVEKAKNTSRREWLIMPPSSACPTERSPSESRRPAGEAAARGGI